MALDSYCRGLTACAADPGACIDACRAVPLVSGEFVAKMEFLIKGKSMDFSLKVLEFVRRMVEFAMGT